MAFKTGAVVAEFRSELQNFKRGLQEVKQDLGDLKSRGEASGAGISASFLKAQLAIEGFRMAMRGVRSALNFATDAAWTASRVEELGYALDAVSRATGTSRDEMGKTVRQLRDLNIAKSEAMEATQLFVQSELELSDAAKLARAAQDLAVVGAMDSSDAFRTLTEAIVSQHPILTRQFGIVFNLNDLYEDYGKQIGIVTEEATKSGKVQRKWARELTQAEKKQAFLNLILKEGEKVAGTYTAAMDSASKKIRSITGRVIPDLKEALGQALLPLLTKLVEVLYKELGNLNDWLEENKDTLKEFGETIADIAIPAVKALLYWIPRIIKFLVENKPLLLGVLAAMGAGFAAMAAGAAMAMGISIAVIGKFILAVTAISAVVGGVTAAVSWLFTREWENIAKTFSDKTGKIKKTLSRHLKQAFEGFALWFKGVFVDDIEDGYIDVAEGASYLGDLLQGYFGEDFGLAVEVGLKNFGEFLAGTREIFKDLDRLIPIWLDDLLNPINDFFKEVKMKLLEFGAEVQSRLEDNFNQLPEIIGWSLGLAAREVVDWADMMNQYFKLLWENLQLSWLHFKQAWITFWEKDLPISIWKFIESAQVGLLQVGENLDVAITNMIVAFDRLLREGPTKLENWFNDMADGTALWVVESMDRFAEWRKRVEAQFDLLTKTIPLKMESMYWKIRQKLDEILLGAALTPSSIVERVGGWVGRGAEAFKGGFMGFQHGGIVPGPIGQPQLAVVHGGERVIPPEQGAGGIEINIFGNISMAEGQDFENTLRMFGERLEQIRKGARK